MRRILAGLGVGLLVLSCHDGGEDRNDDDGGMMEGPQTVEDFLGGLHFGNFHAEMTKGDAPAPGTGPDFDLFGNTSVINGGSTQVQLQSRPSDEGVSVPISYVVAFVEGVSGYWRLDLPVPINSVLLQLTISPRVSEREFVVSFLAGYADSISPVHSLQLFVNPAGIGDVQVSLNWDEPSDLDLHVFDPFGYEVYYGNPLVFTGGELDVDSNSACEIDGINNENVVWERGEARHGFYRVAVNNYDSCGHTPIHFTVTVQRTGAPETVVTGTFNDPGNHLGARAGVTALIFAYPP